jgi:hypothetical protein
MRKMPAGDGINLSIITCLVLDKVVGWGFWTILLYFMGVVLLNLVFADEARTNS